MSSKRISNNNGSQNALLNTVKSVIPKCITKGLNAKELALVENIVNNIFSSYASRDNYLYNIESKSIDAILGRIASLLDEVKQDFTSSELLNVKTDIIESVKKTLIQYNSSNNSIDIELITSKLVLKIELFQELLTTQIKESLTDFIKINKSSNEPNDKINETQISKNILDLINNPDKLNEKFNKDAEELEKIKSEKKKKKTDNSEEEQQKIIISNILLQIDIINKQLGLLFNSTSFAIKNLNEIIDTASKNIDVVLLYTNSLQPNNKDKKDKKTNTNIQNIITKTIIQMSEKLDIIMSSTEDFVALVVQVLNIIMALAYPILTKFFMKFIFVIALPTFVIIGSALSILAEPIKELIEPILSFISNMITKTLTFIEPIRDFILDILKRIFNIIKPALVAFFKGLESQAEAVAIGLGEFVTSVLNVLKLLMDGIASGATALGKALVKLALTIIDVLRLFMEGLGTQAKAIGEGLGRFVTIVLNILALFMEGFGTQAKAIGEALGKVALRICNVTNLIVLFGQNCVGILVAIVGIIRDFFEGIRSKAKAIGEMIGNIIYHFFEGFNTKAEAIGEAMAELALVTAKLLTKIMKFLNQIGRLFELHLVTPFRALKRMINAMKVKAADSSFSIFGCEIHLFSWLTHGMSKEEIELGRADKSVSFSELLADEKRKVIEKFEAEDKAEALKELNDKIMRKKTLQLLDSIHIIDQVLVMIKEIHSNIVGKEKTNEVLAAIQAVKPQLDDITKLLQIEQENNENTSTSLLLQKQEIEKTEDDKNINTESNKSNIMNYLSDTFKKLFESLDNKQPLIMPINNTKQNLAAMEDL